MEIVVRGLALGALLENIFGFSHSSLARVTHFKFKCSDFDSMPGQEFREGPKNKTSRCEIPRLHLGNFVTGFHESSRSKFARTKNVNEGDERALCRRYF